MGWKETDGLANERMKLFWQTVEWFPDAQGLLPILRSLVGVDRIFVRLTGHTTVQPEICCVCDLASSNHLCSCLFSTCCAQVEPFGGQSCCSNWLILSGWKQGCVRLGKWGHIGLQGRGLHFGWIWREKKYEILYFCTCVWSVCVRIPRICKFLPFVSTVSRNKWDVRKTFHVSLSEMVSVGLQGRYWNHTNRTLTGQARKSVQSSFDQNAADFRLQSGCATVPHAFHVPYCTTGSTIILGYLVISGTGVNLDTSGTFGDFCG